MTGIYVHIPYCKRKCFYCNFVSFTNFGDMPQYIQRLTTEIKERATGEPIDTIYIGGGTPSVLYNGAIKTIINTINECFSVQKGSEITIEANPESVTENFADECVISGINRVSLGLQSASDEELLAIGRIHTLKEFLNAYQLLRNKGINNINVDLMLGLPGQDLKTLKDGINSVINIRPDHISIYSLSIEKGCKLYGKFSPDEDKSAELYTYSAETLKNAGYDRYEVSNFSLNGKISRHNYKYWMRENYLGFGTAAHSLISDIRYENPNSNQKYLNGELPKTTVLSTDDIRQEYIMLRLRTTAGIDLNEFHLKFGYRLEERKIKEIEFLTSLDLLKISDFRISLSDKGFYVMNEIIIRLL